ncbi:unnamed protein product [Caenorhabditis auriculariae]|uniref:Bromo domain-containing protein n=1 Tax=Caenorhabditis auriculariae TaxID=2777116 RepID=A0A8S1H369_9PELO|nr:unnamed protein product [Caenorhabditis auriculariae]
MPSGARPPWATPPQDPVNGVVRPRIFPPDGKPTRHTNRLDYILTKVLKEAGKHKHAWPFLKPVDTVQLNIPDYFKVILRPMDLKTIEMRLKNQYYCNAQECIEDIETVFNNCYKYNGPEDDITIMAQNVEKSIKEHLENLPAEETDVDISAKKGKKGASSRLVAGADGKKKDRASEAPSEAGSESSRQSAAVSIADKVHKEVEDRKASKNKATAKRKAESVEADEESAISHPVIKKPPKRNRRRNPSLSQESPFRCRIG